MELGDPWASPLYKLQTFSPHLKLCTVKPLLDTCSCSCIGIGRTCSAHRSMHKATIIVRTCLAHQNMHRSTIIGCTCSEHQSMHGATIIWRTWRTCSAYQYARSNHFGTRMLGASKYARCNHYWPTRSEHKTMRGATITGYLLLAVIFGRLRNRKCSVQPLLVNCSEAIGIGSCEHARCCQFMCVLGATFLNDREHALSDQNWFINACAEQPKNSIKI